VLTAAAGTRRTDTAYPRLLTRKPRLANRTSSPSCSRPAPRKPNSIEAMVACGLGSVAGELAALTVKLVRGGILAVDATSSAM
jgi:hypothetical protein